jgi:hypothetical protein
VVAELAHTLIVNGRVQSCPHEFELSDTRKSDCWLRKWKLATGHTCW